LSQLDEIAFIAGVPCSLDIFFGWVWEASYSGLGVEVDSTWCSFSVAFG
jgi:hypothetical protein